MTIKTKAADYAANFASWFESQYSFNTAEWACFWGGVVLGAIAALLWLTFSSVGPLIGCYFAACSLGFFFKKPILGAIAVPGYVAGLSAMALVVGFAQHALS